MNNSKPRLTVFYGTRPQVVKASQLLTALRRRFDVFAADTGQHYDYLLNGVLYEQLGVAPPDAFLEVGSAAHAEQTAAVLSRSADVIEAQQPVATVVIGDTNSTVGAALASVKLRIPVVHVEAGLRSGDSMMAEEINRRIVDVIGGLLCAPSEMAVAVLRRESAAGTIVNTGDVARDVLEANIGRTQSVNSIQEWPVPAGESFVFATLHRAELTSSPSVLRGVLHALDSLPYPVVLAAHPRTQQAIAALGLALTGNLHVRAPLGYLEALACTRAAQAVVTDSGGLQREAYWVGTPCVTLREETEWTETVECGANTTLSPVAAEALLNPVLQAAVARRGWDNSAYGTGRSAAAITDAIASWLAGD